MERVKNQIGVLPAAEYGKYTGRGVTVAVLDTGISRHPDLRNRIRVFRDFVNNRNDVYDDCGHGTHVCGIIGGDGYASGGRYSGIAPKVQFVIGKVLDKDGEGSADNMISALEWILKIRTVYQIRVLNISVGINNLKDRNKEKYIIELMELIWDCGVTVICAAGNNGPESGSLSALGKSRKIITVGCHDGQMHKNKSGSCDNYSGRGDLFSPLRKPDVVAPGTDIISCNAFYLNGKNNYYVKKSGTSMATPIVTGVAALFFEKYPHFRCDDFKKRLTYTASDLGEPWNKQGWGMVNVQRLLG